MNNHKTLETIFVALIAILADCVSGFKYGPSLTSLPSPVLKLEDYPNYSVLVPLAKHKITAYPYELAQEDARWRDIKVIIKAPEGFRIMMVVQILYLGLGYEHKLERDLRAVLGLKSCIDSVQIFEHGELAEEICGSVNYTDKSAHPNSLSGPRTFLSKGNSLIVGLQFAKRLRQTTDSHLLHLEYRHKIDILSRKFSLGIAFTSFKECDQISKSLNELENLRPCYVNKSSEGEDDTTFTGECINANIFCDGVMNCANDGDNMTTIGSDEDAHHCILSSLQNSDKPGEFGSQMISFRPQDQYFHDLTTVMPPSMGNINNFHHDLTLGPSSTVLLIVLTILSVMILGVIIRLCCTKCVGTSHHTPRLSTVSETASDGSVWAVSPTYSNRIRNSRSNGGNNSNLFPNFIVHSQCSRFDAGKDLPPSYDDLFPVEVSKPETEVQMTYLPTSAEIQSLQNNDSNSVATTATEILHQQITIELDNNNEPKIAESSAHEA